MRGRATQYFEDILGSVDSVCTLREALKTVLRDHAQGLIGGKKKERNMQAANLKREIVALEAYCEWDRGAEGSLQHQLRLKCYELHALATQHAWAYALVTQRLLLVGQEGQATSMGQAVESKDSGLCETNESMAEAFAAYYEEVYTSVIRMTEEDCADLLRDIPLPGLLSEERDVLDGKLSDEEVTATLRGFSWVKR
ncbi:hypothetical protein NDU88_010345 [Pleurodeles waltl]|uniref:Uncharacterized protein n=1 Tax=Pleurodeles waltl TaxID=8319 RepID=A0AAV7S315_PLEWA|nr:hypothetical protein NDU88_010345 [Pleurodeles waltl]